MQPTDLGLPFDEFRGGQLEAAIDVASTDKRFPMVNAPTGSGKSLLGMTTGALAGGRTLYVVSTKGLQDQVGGEFSGCGVADVRGASNYRCKHHRTGCDVGGEVGCPLRKADGPCPYTAAVRRARNARTVVTNYAYRLATANQRGESIGEFDLLVLDEAHLAHDALASHASIELHRDVVHRELRARLPDSLDVDELAAWAVGVADGATIAARQQLQNRSLQKVCSGVVRLAALASRSSEWAADPTSGDEGVVVAPVWAGEFAESALYRGVPKVLLMSATLLPGMRQYLGIDESASQWYELPSSFPAYRRPFQFVRGTMPIRVDHRMDEGRWGMLVSRIDRYMGARIELKRRGLVHTRSYARQSQFERESRHRDVMAVPKGWELRRAVERFKSGTPPPYVLASPAIEEGHDFKGDSARWQVLLKVPFVDTRGNLMKARAKDKGYGNLMAAQTVIQCVGRVMRAGDDYGESVIFDDHWSWFRGAVRWPKWFSDAFVEYEQAPQPLEA